MTEVIINIALVLKEQNQSIKNHPIYKKFPKPPYNSPIIESFHQILIALCAEQDKNWGLAKKAWKKASIIRGQEYYFILLCTESLTNIALFFWRDEPSDKHYNKLIQCLKEWMILCQNKNLIPCLCKVYFQFQLQVM